MTERVLVLGEPARFVREIAQRMGRDIDVVYATTADETEGIGVDVVVAAGRFPLAELTSVRVHPTLHALPVVLVVPGRRLDPGVWRRADVTLVQTPRDIAGHIASAVHRTLLRRRARLTQTPARAGERETIRILEPAP